MERSKTGKALLVILVAYVVLMAAFTFLDYPIAQAAYHPGTPYAKLIRFYRLESLGASFEPWYVIQEAMPFGDRFNSSFPSGHAAKSIMPIALLVLPYLMDRLKTAGSRRVMVACCVAFMLCTWVARMMDGMHYASDVLTGSTIVVVTFLLAKLHYLDGV